MNKGNLYLIPSLLGDGEVAYSLPIAVIRHIQEIKIFIVEDIRSARRFIKKVDPKKDIDSCEFYAYGKHDQINIEQSVLHPILQGNNVGIISEAGLPCVADPGSKIVNFAHQFQIRIIPLIGPSSIFLALMASGLSGQNFVFHGYLPIEKKEREHKIRQMDNHVYKSEQSQIFMETPYRNNALLKDLIAVCNPNTKLCIASDITLSTEQINTKTIAEWKPKPIDLHKKPTIFILGS